MPGLVLVLARLGNVRKRRQVGHRVSTSTRLTAALHADANSDQLHTTSYANVYEQVAAKWDLLKWHDTQRDAGYQL